MNFDITYQFMIPMVELFYKWTHSYGWGIVLVTLAVRALLWGLVANQTKSMMRMSQVQPHIKAIQERYGKSDPEMFSKKSMEFYQKNKINPMGGCFPLLIQLPILLALFGTFTGPPFGDKPIEVKVKVVAPAQASEAHRNEASGGSVPYISPEHQLAKVVVFPGDCTVVENESVDFSTRALQGELPANFQCLWNIFGKASDMKGMINTEPLGHTFHCTFQKPGEYVVKAIIPGIAKHEPFGFIASLGKVAKGAELLKPENFDSVALILLFGLTMFISQKYSMPKPQTAIAEMDETQLAQQQSMKLMPLMMTGMFFFIPLPTGVYLYMVISNVVQSMQTFLVMKQPVPDLISVLDDPMPGQGFVSSKPSGSQVIDTPYKSAQSPAAKKNGTKESTKEPKQSKEASETNDIPKLENNGKNDSSEEDSSIQLDKRKKKKK